MPAIFALQKTFAHRVHSLRANTNFGNVTDDRFGWISISGLTRGRLAAGQAFTSAPYISVEWPWLILPVVLWFLTTVNLITVILLTWRASVPVWKSSLLAALDSRGFEVRGQALQNIKRRGVSEEVELSWTSEIWRLQVAGKGKKKKKKSQQCTMTGLCSLWIACHLILDARISCRPGARSLRSVTQCPRRRARAHKSLRAPLSDTPLPPTSANHGSAAEHE
jgi:hypothetical protein